VSGLTKQQDQRDRGRTRLTAASRARSLLPGLFDCHVHLIVGPYDPVVQLHDPFSLQFYRAAANMRLTLAAGITTVRDACGADMGIKMAQQRGMIPGPRVHLSINQTGPRKVPECLIHRLVMPSSGRTRVASRALRHRAAATMLSVDRGGPAVAMGGSWIDAIGSVSVV
jgi:Amidohydrolase family